MNPAEELEAWLETATEKVRRNVTVVTPETIHQPYFLHISTDTTIKSFTPIVGRRQSNMEDRTIPRVAVAPTIFGCFIGYAAAHHDFFKLASSGKKEDLNYKGGWLIYALPFEAALKPSRKLLFDTEMSDEHWLVSYSKRSIEYKPVPVGKVFYRSINLLAKSGSHPTAEGVMYFEILKEEGLRFSKNILLTKGYWVVEGPMNYGSAFWDDDAAFTIREIDKPEYMTTKNLSASLLNFTEKPPSYFNW